MIPTSERIALLMAEAIQVAEVRRANQADLRRVFSNVRIPKDAKSGKWRWIHVRPDWDAIPTSWNR